MSTKKAGGSTRLGRDSISKRLGVKVFGDQVVKKGAIIIRQRGTKFHPGKNVLRAEDDTLYAKSSGVVKFLRKKVRDFTGKLTIRKFVSVVSEKKK